MIITLILRKEGKMNKIITESPRGLKVTITAYRDGEGEIETTNNIGMKWHLWFDHIEDIVFIADVLNDYIAELNLRKEADNGER